MASDYLRLQLANEDREVFGVIFLNSDNKLISFEKLFFGTINEATIHARIVVKRALELNSTAVILAHNHPSGNPMSSGHDIAITQSLKKILNIVDVKLLDHIIVTKKECSSAINQIFL